MTYLQDNHYRGENPLDFHTRAVHLLLQKPPIFLLHFLIPHRHAALGSKNVSRSPEYSRKLRVECSCAIVIQQLGHKPRLGTCCFRDRNCQPRSHICPPSLAFKFLSRIYTVRCKVRPAGRPKFEWLAKDARITSALKPLYPSSDLNS